MAQWKETLEPYANVTESVKTTTLNPTAGEDLVIGAVIIADSGSATPTLVSSQKEFLEKFATKDLSEDYMKELNHLYSEDPESSVASTLWLNAYRLSGSAKLLVSRATKSTDILYTKSLRKNDDSEYVIRDTDILKKCPPFRILIDHTSLADGDGWLLAVSEVGTLGNRVTDEGAQYDYDIYNLKELVEKLNETNKFFSPKYSFYKAIYDEVNGYTVQEWRKLESEAEFEDADMVVLEEVYLAAKPIDTEDDRTKIAQSGKNSGAIGLIIENDITDDASPLVRPVSNYTIDLNAGGFGGYETPEWYATNTYNSNTDLKVRIRRFNHNAVRTKNLTESQVKKGESPWIVLTSVLDTYTSSYGYDMSGSGAQTALNYDFYEFAIYDPSISEDWLIYNVGNIPGRGDIDIATLNESIGMFQLNLPDDLKDLGLNYYGYPKDNGKFLTDAEIGNDVKSHLEAKNQDKGSVVTAENGHWRWSGTGEDVKIVEVKEAINDNGNCYINGHALADDVNFIKSDFNDLKKLITDDESSINLDKKFYILGSAGTVESYALLTPQESVDGYYLKVKAGGTTEVEGSIYSHDGGIIYNVEAYKTQDNGDVQDTPVPISQALENLGDAVIKVSCYDAEGALTDGDLILLPEGEEANYGEIPTANLPESGYIKLSLHVNKTEEEPDVVVYENYLFSDQDVKERFTSISDRTVGDYVTEVYYYTKNGETEINTNVKISDSSFLLEVSNSDIKAAWDRIEEDERYVVEGMCDCGCTIPEVQNYLGNLSKNSNYFYPPSLINSTNYMAIANYKKKLKITSHKSYFLAPWDYDSGTSGFPFSVSPSVLYWETVCRNKANNQEFKAAFGQEGGIVYPENLAKSFSKSERQLLLTKKINTVFHDLYLDRYYINDNVTAQEEDNVMKEECNARMEIRISKALPLLLNQFKGRQNTENTRKDVEYVIDYWFRNTVMTYGSTILGFKVTCNSSNNSEEDIRANRLRVKVEVRYPNSVKYIEVANIAYPIGLDFE